jgi:hypothetical protein
MEVIRTRIPDVLILEPRVHGDARGFFLESWNAHTFHGVTGLDVQFVQDNHSRSARGVLRGLHYQIRPPAGQAGAGQPRQRCSTWWSTCAAEPDLRPVGGRRARAARTSARCGSRRASRMASWCSPRVPTSSTRPPTTTPRARAQPAVERSGSRHRVAAGRSSNRDSAAKDVAAPGLAACETFDA